MTFRAKFRRQIADQGADIEAFAGPEPESGEVLALGFDQFGFVNGDLAGLEFDRLPRAGEIIGALAIDLHGAELGRNLLDVADESGQRRAEGLDGRTHITSGDLLAF